jgi:molybdate transport system substrate-binding protein
VFICANLWLKTLVFLFSASPRLCGKKFWRASAIIAFIFAIPASAETITISAAISLKESLTEIGKSYEAATHDHLIFNFDASGKLAMQIMQGAPVDAFVSADDEQMNKLANTGKIKADTRRVIVNNSLVLIAPIDEKDPPAGFADLGKIHDLKICIGEPKTVPAGHYAMQTLKAMKLDQAVASRLVFGESVRQVLTYVEAGEVYAGIVYSTDALLAKGKVKVIATADAGTHDVIEYPAAVVTASSHQEAAAKFLDYLATDQAKAVFVARGFATNSPRFPTTRPGP